MASKSFIIGDAGGTSTQWRVVKNGEIQQFETIGFNAYTHNFHDLKGSIQETFGKEIESNVPTFFYAAGVDTDEQRAEVTESLEDIFGAYVEVENDLIGVARSLCGKEEGNVCILGTGSNACYYDGLSVNKVSASLGYVLGDEGSGAYMGKKLMMGVFRGYFSEEIISEFQEEFGLTSHDVIQRIYHEPRPNHFLASFSRFIGQRKSHPEIYGLISDSFQEFFNSFFFKEERTHLPFYFSGSIAYHYSDILRQVASDKGYSIKTIAQSPIAGLVLYHQQYE
ncbi:BadF-type ATPase [Ekhidna lutea]|uniref:BadF-type ATPase n=1 Tax=Ekhidna lutea TaxID=447679 RepID=A0A239K0Z6_EKHLU|nr:hypothetical protein [Ekhidna lutea]SNT11353.1 BadF-type ATPase [Ekhidna lutea]